MIGNVVSRRYAAALFSIGKEAGMAELERYGASLGALGEAVEKTPRLAEAFRNPVLSTEEKKKVALALLDVAGGGAVEQRFCALLADKDRLPLLPAIALGAVTDIPIWAAILLCGVATIIYCFFGGVDAVIWCDFVQGLILLGGAIVVLVALVIGSGGPSEFASVAWEADKFRTWDFRFLFGEPVFWVVLIMGLVSNLNSYTADQCVVQRYITTPDEKAAARSIWFNGILSVISSVIFYLIGTALYTHYCKHPELMDVTMPKSDSIFPTFMAIELHPIVAGLIVASIFAATISTLATNLNSSATSLVTDFIARFRKDMDGDAQVRWGRWLVIVVGVAGVAAALILSVLPSRSLFDVFQNFIGTLTGGLSALFLIGIFMPRVSGLAAMIALVANYAISLGIGFVFPDLHPFTYGGIGLAVCVLLAWLLSFPFPNAKPTEGLTHFSRPKGE